MSDDIASDVVVWRCWCEHTRCDWSKTIEAEHDVDAQEGAAAALFAHGLEQNHYSTRMERDDER